MRNTPVTWPRAELGGGASAARRRFALQMGGSEIALSRGELLLGRSRSCQVIVDDMLVSRHHARLLVSHAALFVEDLGSTNGVIVNEAPIAGPTPLTDGDRIIVGTQEMVVRAVDDGVETLAPATRPGSASAWAAATRPRSLLIAFSPVLVGAALGWARTGAIDAAAALLVLAAALLMQLITNLQNDVGYTLRGAERSGTRTGLPRATAQGWLGVAQVRVAIVLLSLLAIALGLALVMQRGWPVLAMGLASIAADVIRTVPRELGRRLQGLTVMAGNLCNGVPKRSSDKGWICHCTLARACAASDRVIMQSCEAAMVMGPRLANAYCSAIQGRPSRE